jgi:hypothetical protein
MALGKKLNGTLRSFIERQPVFFVATAADTGRVNLSPKGSDSLRILDDNRLLWLNLSGSGNETAGHIRLQNRITLMFCAFDGDPLILRLYGTARVIHPRDADWDEMIGQFPKMAGSRQLFDVSVEALQTSCGSGVPEMAFKRDRVPDDLVPFFDEMGPDGVTDYWRRKNTETIDGFDTKLFED